MAMGGRAGVATGDHEELNCEALGINLALNNHEKGVIGRQEHCIICDAFVRKHGLQVIIRLETTLTWISSTLLNPRQAISLMYCLLQVLASKHTLGIIYFKSISLQ